MGSTKRTQTISLPIVDSELLPLREGVSDLGDEPTKDAMAPDVSGKIKITLTEYSNGPEQITVVHLDGDDRESYPFVVTDTDRRLCAYKRHGEKAPPHIRRALCQFGYHDTTGPPDDPIWFAAYARVANPMLHGYLRTADSLLLTHLLGTFINGCQASLRTIFVARRFDSPQDVPDELVDEILSSGDESPLYGSTSWNDHSTAVAYGELGRADWEFDQTFLPQPPRSSNVDWDDILTGGSIGDRTAEEVEQSLADSIAESPGISFIDDPEAITDNPNIGLDPDEGADVQVNIPDKPEPEGYIRVNIYGVESVTQHEFRIVTLPDDESRGTCVYEQRDETAALPPYPATHAVSAAGFTVKNVPTFPLDSTLPELVKNTHKLVTTVNEMAAVPDGVKSPVGMQDMAFTLLWYAVIAVDTSKPELLDATAEALYQDSIGEPLESVLKIANTKIERAIIEFVRDNHPETDAIEEAYNNSWIPNRLHLDHTDVFDDLPDDATYNLS